MPIYMKFSAPSSGGTVIKGSSQDPAHPAWVDTESVSWGVQAANVLSPHSGSAEREESSRAQEIHATTHDGTCLSSVFLSCANGTHYKKIEVHFVKSTEKPDVFMKLELSEVLISSVRTMGRSSDSLPGIEFVLSFLQIKFQTMDASTAAAPASGWTNLQPSPPAKTK